MIVSNSRGLRHVLQPLKFPKARAFADVEDQERAVTVPPQERLL